jgi:hypothetical protein
MIKAPKGRGRRVLLAMGAITLLGGAAVGAITLSPAVAQQAHTLGVIANTYFSCHSAASCTGGVNTGTGFGVLAVAASANGVDSATDNPSHSNGYGRSGVYGHDDSNDFGQLNVGVAGFSYWGTGVQGTSNSGYGMKASSTQGIGLLVSGGYIGVQASSVNGDAIDASSTGSQNAGTLGVWSTGSPAVYAVSTGDIAVDAESSPGDLSPPLFLSGGAQSQNTDLIDGYDSGITRIFAVDDSGNEHITGQLFTHGSCSIGCSKTRHVTSYTPRESAPSMEDVGEGQLTAGTARVLLDPAFANVIDKHANYDVFVSPEGPSRGVYVTQKSQTGFTVTENPDGQATIPFSYRIVAKPYGVTAARLPMIDDPKPQHRGRAHHVPARGLTH